MARDTTGDGAGDATAAHRAALFDLAVARASLYLDRARPPREPGAAAIAAALEPWYLKTRFAPRVPLRAVAQALATRPPGPGWRWRGGPDGGWVRDASDRGASDDGESGSREGRDP